MNTKTAKGRLKNANTGRIAGAPGRGAIRGFYLSYCRAWRGMRVCAIRPEVGCRRATALNIMTEKVGSLWQIYSGIRDI